MSVAIDLMSARSKSAFARLKTPQGLLADTPPSAAVSLAWPELEGVLPDHGFPKGVVELTSSRTLGGATRVALGAIRGAQERGPEVWCAWLDPEGSLYAPGVTKSGVDLKRMLVVRPPRKDLGRVAVKLAQAHAFDVIVLDYSYVAFVQPTPLLTGARAGSGSPRRGRSVRSEVLVRKLALLAEEGGSTIILLTDSTEPRPVPWPVALRLELSRTPSTLTVKVVKDRFCRLGSAKIPWPTDASAAR